MRFIITFLFLALSVSLIGSTKKPITVTIFSGHAKLLQNKGCTSYSGIREWRFNDSVVKYFKDFNYSDVKYVPFFATLNIPVRRRVFLTRQYSGDLFIEIHHDSANEEDIKKIGKQTKNLTCRFDDGKELKTDDDREKPDEDLLIVEDLPFSEDEIKLKEEWDKISGFSVFYSSENEYPDESLSLATLIGFNLLKAGFKPNPYHSNHIFGERKKLVNPQAGVYEAPFFVLKNEVPSVIVECGVIVNPFDEDELKKEEVKKKIAKAIDTAVKMFKQNVKMVKKTDFKIDKK